MVTKRYTLSFLLLTSLAFMSPISMVQAQNAVNSAPAVEGPDALIKRLASEITEAVRSDKDLAGGDIAKITALVDSKVIPFVNFQRMTASSVGPAWRRATPEQQKRLQEEFKILLIRSYAGALKEIKNRTVSVKPLRLGVDDTSVIVRSEVQGQGEPIELDYRLSKVMDAANKPVWKIYDINVVGVWLVETYRSQFAQEINASGIDGLIKVLADKNKNRYQPK